MPSSSRVASASITDWPFVGRERELDQLRAQLDRAVGGQGGLVLLLGEPGIGKTRIAEEVAAEADAKGAAVVWARSWECEGAPVYWSWAQVLRSLLEDEDEAVRAAVEGAGAELAQILPELAGARSGGPEQARSDSTESRFRLFDTVAKVLRCVARARPLVVVLDDLHWADQPSLLLLHFVARGLRRSRLLILGTYRDVEVGPRHPLVEVLGQLARESTRVPLSGLNQRDIGEVLAQVGGVEPAPSLVTAIYEQTEGNPFFVSEVVRLLRARDLLGAADAPSPWEAGIPQGAREMISGHLGRLSERCRQVLSTAAVLGREFDASLLERVNSIAVDDLLDTLQEASEANVVEESGPHPGRFAFTHALFRDSIYADLGPAMRVWLHREVGKALEGLGNRDRSRHLAMLAHHFFQADPASSKALDYTVDAGNYADACLAYEEAARYYERAIEILDAQGGDDQGQRCELLLSLGDARSKSADVAGAKSAFKAAADTARRVNAPHLFARAALGYGGRFPGLVTGVVDRVLVGLLEQSLTLLGEGDTALRAMVVARLSRALFYGAPEDRRLSLSEEALAMARAAGDAPSEVAALNAKFWALARPEKIHERLETATRMATLAMRSGDIEMALQGHQWRLCVLAELGDMVAVDIEIEEYAKLADQLHQPLYSWFAVQFRVMRALMTGRFTEAERRAHEAVAAGERIVTSAPVSELFAVQLFQLRWEQGGWEQAEQMLEASGRNDASSRALASLYRCRFGDQPVVDAEVAALLQRDFSVLPRDTVWLGTVVMLAEVTVLLGDRAAGERLYPLLLPYAERNVMVGGALLCRGSASHFLGLLAALGGRHDEAVAYFEKALEMNSAMGAAPLVARTQYEYGRVLIEDCGSAQPAESLLEQATNTAADLGMKPLVDQCQQLRRKLGEPGPGPAPLPAVDIKSGENCFRKAGQFWEVRFSGQEVRVKDTKGMQYIATLLRHAGREVHVADLVGAGGIEFGDAGEVLDSQAKGQYQARIKELREDLAEAEDRNDLGRMDAASQELDFITQELAAAYGLSGRSRKGADTGERMRKAVTNRIRASVANLAQHNPRLGQHLTNSISTGNFCGYLPEEPTRWNV